MVITDIEHEHTLVIVADPHDALRARLAGQLVTIESTEDTLQLVRVPAPGTVPMTVLPVTLADDLQLATWEDAEWQ